MTKKIPLVSLTLICLSLNPLRSSAKSHRDGEWRHFGGDAGGQRYSGLNQINRKNVARLKRAWTYHTGDYSDGTVYRTLSCFEATPLMADGVLYVTTPFARAIALDPETGKELWTYDPKIDRTKLYNLFINRGPAYWTDGKDRRIIYGTLEGKLIALDARTGKPCQDFGENGIVDMHEGFRDKYPNAMYGVTSAPTIYKNIMIVSVLVEAKVGPSPAVRAFDVRTGKQVWQFDTVPKPGQVGHDTWEEDSWVERSGTNVWMSVSVDEKRGVAFLPVTSHAYDFYGGDRKGQNLFGDSLVAVNANTGERIWHFQIVHHDLWDYDLPAQPNLVTVVRNGKKVDAVAQVTKMGFVFVFDRLTGNPLFPVEERPVPSSEIPGEKPWPTQPIPLKPRPIARQSITADELSRVTPESYAKAKKWFEQVIPGPIYTPPGSKPMLMFPGLNGGANWPGASFDPTTGWLYVAISNLGTVIQMVARPEGSFLPYIATFPSAGIAKFPFFMDGETGWPLQQPPWGTLVAINLNTGDIEWEKPLGIVKELMAAGVPPTGTINLGGSIVTAGGLVFVGGTTDSMFRALDKKTGALLWETEVEAPAFAAPMTYSGPKNRKQYVVIAAGGGNKYTKKFSDALVAFALP